MQRQDKVQHLHNWFRVTVGPHIKQLFLILIWYQSGMCIASLCISYVAQF